MGTMFTSPARPFYQSVTLYGLKPLPLEKYTDFCISHFSNRGKAIDKNVISTIYDKFDGITYYMQRVMNELFAHTKDGDTCTISDIDAAVCNIIDISSPIYEDLLYQLPEKQALTLRAIGKEGKVTNITSGKFVKKYGLISANSIKSAVPALIDKGLLTFERGEYSIYDRFFAMWLNKN
jgi:tRNA uridine 5-carbamoylmethylation protein Kti12